MKQKLLVTFAAILVIFVGSMKLITAQSRILSRADEKFQKHQYLDAMILYKKAYCKIDDKSKKTSVLNQIGYCYYATDDLHNAAKNFLRTIKSGYAEKETYFLYAESLKRLGDFENALRAYQEMKIMFQYDLRADIGIAFCQNKIDSTLSQIPALKFTLTGIVRDENTKSVVANAEVKIEGSDGSKHSEFTDANGTYYFNETQILENVTYKILVLKESYYREMGMETTVGLNTSIDLHHDFNLIPIP